MKVQSGRYKGTALTAKAQTHIRPTADKIKLWIFQIINPYISDVSFLDLFAGSGNIGIEAISRGCQYAAFVDNATGSLIRKNLSLLQSSVPARIYNEDVLYFLRRRHPVKMMFHIIFADPPYQYPYFLELIHAVSVTRIFAENGIFILESGKHSLSPELYESEYLKAFALLREKHFGETKISIFQKES